MSNAIACAARAIGMLSLACVGTASAHESRPNRATYAAPQAIVLPPAEGVGCFWHLGHRSCSRYCYWEVDGYRYCTTHERDAYSQTIHPFARHHGRSTEPPRRAHVLK